MDLANLSIYNEALLWRSSRAEIDGSPGNVEKTGAFVSGRGCPEECSTIAKAKWFISLLLCD